MRRSVAAMMLLLTVGSTETVETNTQLVVRQVAVQTDEVETPYADSLIDWDEQDRENDCLWEFLQDAEVELTLDTVIAAGDWTDALGGACAAIGED
ncbi:MAG TPA: hypothetical protein VIG24_16650 [Acidimicrobiia bacterium]